jgi:tRNA A37 threonylcarbamoyladenosine synthetase subunit TsaC/SUA5/YrdC
MRAETAAEICEAHGTQMRSTAAGIRGELEQDEAATARQALGDRVIAAIEEEESTLLGAQRLRPPAIQVG